ncbi:MAG: polyphosphate kinase 2 family protein [Planctomycetaceae bacterium]|nr:polyphosphate kinase 2 family protein [Planctomycetaceae bacterium]
MKHPHLITPGQKIQLQDFSTRGKDFHNDREQAETELVEYRQELAEWQRALYAEGKQSLLVVLQAMDTGGKDGTIRHVFRGVNPQGVHVASFKQPSARELQHDFLWRVHREVPGRGMIGVFNRSHYEDVLVVRVENIVPRNIWTQRYELINQFEELLAHNQTRILKFYLHISPDEQLERFRKRLEKPNKRWKFSPHDLEHRKHWHRYQEAYADVLEKCSTREAPWFAVPADQKWYRNWIICKTIVETLREMNPQYPSVDWEPDDFDLEP